MKKFLLSLAIGLLATLAYYFIYTYRVELISDFPNLLPILLNFPIQFSGLIFLSDLFQSIELQVDFQGLFYGLGFYFLFTSIFLYLIMLMLKKFKTIWHDMRVFFPLTR